MKRARETAKELNERLARQSRYDFERGVTEGLKREQDSTKLKLVEANIKLAQQLGHMIEATARAVITFIGEGGIRA